MNKLPGGEWYPICLTHGPNVCKETRAMKVPTGVLVKHSTMFAPSGSVDETMVFIPGNGIKVDDKRPSGYALCLEINNQVED